MYYSIIFSYILSNVDYFVTGQYIPLDAIDKFWAKLDFSTAYQDVNSNVNVNNELEKVAMHFEDQPEHVKRSWMSQIKKIIGSSKTDEKPPNVVQKTRGRPRKDKQQQQHYENDPPRHSSYLQSQTKDSPTKQPSLQRSQSMSLKTRRKQNITYTSGDEEMNNAIRFKEWIPELWHQYIKSTVDVQPDGNCGYRAVAVALGRHENEYPLIRQELLQELHANAHHYMRMFPDFNAVQASLLWNGLGFCPRRYWMEMPPAGILVANRYRLILVYLSISNNLTFFPFWISPYEVIEHKMIAIGLVNGNHYIKLELEGDYPIPEATKYFKHYKSQEASNWEFIYRSRIQRYLASRPRTECQETINIT